MIMADVFTVVFIIVGLWLALPALSLLLRALAPQLVERAERRSTERAGRSFLAGLAVAVPAVLFIAVLGKTGAKPLAFLAGSALLLFAFIGVAGFAARIGKQLASPRDAERPWMATVRGCACLEIAGTLPIVGWFVVWPIALLIGIGSATMALFGGRKPVAAPLADATWTPAAAPMTANPISGS